MYAYLLNIFDPAVRILPNGKLRAKVPLVWRILVGRGRESAQ